MQHFFVKTSHFFYRQEPGKSSKNPPDRRRKINLPEVSAIGGSFKSMTAWYNQFTVNKLMPQCLLL